MEFCLDREIPQWIHPDWDKTILDLGPGTKFTVAKAIRLDYPDWDGEAQDCLRDFVDDELGGIFAINLLEHLSDPRFLIAEMARVLAPGCPVTIFVPHALSGMYLQDLDHKTPFILDTFKNHLDAHPYYTKGRRPLGLRVGFNMKFGIKEENTGILTQLIKEGDR
jgi:SAM-dependent methyltransferase